MALYKSQHVSDDKKTGLFHKIWHVHIALSVCVPALVEGVDLDAVMCVLLQDLLGVFICVEGIHEHQWHVCIIRLIQMLKDRDSHKIFNLINQ